VGVGEFRGDCPGSKRSELVGAVEDLPSSPAFGLNESRPNESIEQSFELLLKLLPTKRVGRIRVFGQSVAGETESYELAAKRAEWAVRRLEQAIPG
jgi:hypothetical protein